MTLQSHKLPTPLEVTKASGGLVTSFSGYTIIQSVVSTSCLDLSLIKKIRLQQDLVKNYCHAHMVDFWYLVPSYYFCLLKFAV